MCETPDNPDSSVEEQLVAYLDGELDADASLEIEKLLATDPRLRQTLQRLDRTWELLDELDTPPVADSFTQTTLEMVTVAAAEKARQDLAVLPPRRRRRWAIVGGTLVAAGLAGFLAAMMFARGQDRNRQLVEDLPLLENVEQYRLLVSLEQNRQADEFEFLQMLSGEGLFVEEINDDEQ